ncbi:MAG: transporter [Flavobacteriales bacterium]|nr:transporter [Flavobacteriales bacterium]
MSKCFQLLFASLLLCLSALQVRAQFSETIASDRPCMTNAATTVGARVLQFQVGGDFAQSTLNSRWSSGFSGGMGEAVIRVGIAERLEVNFTVAYMNMSQEKKNNYSTNQIEDLNYAFRLRGNVVKANGAIPSIGLFAEVSFPKKGTPMYQNSIRPKFLILIEQQLESRVKLSSNIGMTWLNAPTLQYTLNLSVAVSPRVSMYLEHFGQYYAAYGNQTNYLGSNDLKIDYWYPRINGGVSFLVTNDLQLDVQSGVGKWLVSPNPEQRDWYVGIGLSYRMRFKQSQKKENAATGG